MKIEVSEPESEMQPLESMHPSTVFLDRSRNYFMVLREDSVLFRDVLSGDGLPVVNLNTGVVVSFGRMEKFFPVHSVLNVDK